MLSSRNPVFSRGFAYNDLDPEIFSEETGAVRRLGDPSTSTMTIEGTVTKAAVMFIPLLGIAAIAYVIAPPVLILPAIFVALGLGLWASMSKKVRPGVMFAYALVEGLVLGLLSRLFETQYPGIVTQAVLATLLTAGAVFALYRMRIVRATKKFTKILLFAGAGYFVFLLVNFGFALTGAGDGWGIYATPFGLLVAAFGAFLASAFLVLDFDAIEKGVEQKAPEIMEWRAAFGLMLTLVWLYVEMLRLIAIIRR